MLLTASEYFEEAGEYDEALKCLLMCNEREKARALCTKICDPKRLLKYSTDKNLLIKTYLGCIAKCIKNNLLNKANQLGKELIDIHEDGFTQAVFDALVSLEQGDVSKLGRAFTSLHKSVAKFVDDDTRSFFINVLYDKSKEYNIVQHLFNRKSGSTILQICPNCGGNNMMFNEKEDSFVCQYCGTKITRT